MRCLYCAITSTVELGATCNASLPLGDSSTTARGDHAGALCHGVSLRLLGPDGPGLRLYARGIFAARNNWTESVPVCGL